MISSIYFITGRWWFAALIWLPDIDDFQVGSGGMFDAVGMGGVMPLGSSFPLPVDSFRTPTCQMPFTPVNEDDLTLIRAHFSDVESGQLVIYQNFSELLLLWSVNVIDNKLNYYQDAPMTQRPLASTIGYSKLALIRTNAR